MILTTSSPCHLASTASNPCSDTGSLSHLGPCYPSSCKLIVLRNHPQPWCSLMLSSINGISTSTNHFLAKKLFFSLEERGRQGKPCSACSPIQGAGARLVGAHFGGAAASRGEPSEGAAAALAGALQPRGAPRPPQSTATHRDLCGTRAIDVLCAWGQLNGSSVISLSRG